MTLPVQPTNMHLHNMSFEASLRRCWHVGRAFSCRSKQTEYLASGLSRLQNSDNDEEVTISSRHETTSLDDTTSSEREVRERNPDPSNTHTPAGGHSTWAC